MSDRKSSTQSARTITMSNAHRDFPAISSHSPDADTLRDTSADESFEEEVKVILLRKSTRCKRLTRIATYMITRSGRSVLGANGRVNHWLSLVGMAVLVSQRDHVWCVICAEEDG